MNLVKLTTEEMRHFLEALEYEINGEGFIIKDGEKVLDPYVEQPVKIGNCSVFPGKKGETIILDDNALSISLYFEEFPEHDKKPTNEKLHHPYENGGIE